jgi:hypothetical protein
MVAEEVVGVVADVPGAVSAPGTRAADGVGSLVAGTIWTGSSVTDSTASSMELIVGGGGVMP